MGKAKTCKMMKQTSQLKSSREIKLPRQISLNSETVGFFSIFDATGVKRTLKTGFLKNPKKYQIFKKCPFKIDEI